VEAFAPRGRIWEVSGVAAVRNDFDGFGANVSDPLAPGGSALLTGCVVAPLFGSERCGSLSLSVTTDSVPASATAIAVDTHL
jgi:hypothetical protein